MEKKVREERLRMLKDRISSPEKLVRDGGIPQIRFLSNSIKRHKNVDAALQAYQRSYMSSSQNEEWQPDPDIIMEDEFSEDDTKTARTTKSRPKRLRVHRSPKKKRGVKLGSSGLRVKMYLGRKKLKNNQKSKKYQSFKNYGRKRALKTFSSYQKNYENILKRIRENELIFRLPKGVRETHENFNQYYYVEDDDLVFPIRAIRDVQEPGVGPRGPGTPQLDRPKSISKIEKKIKDDRFEDYDDKKKLFEKLEEMKKQRLYQRLRKAKRRKYKIKSAKMPKPIWAQMYDGPEEFEAFVMDMPNDLSLAELNPDIEVIFFPKKMKNLKKISIFLIFIFLD